MAETHEDGASISLKTVIDTETALFETILSFLSVDDAGALCRAVPFVVSKLQVGRALPCSILHERLPTTVSYIQFRYEDGDCWVHQNQPFAVLVLTGMDQEELKLVRVHFKLVNYCWEEKNNQRVGTDGSNEGGATILCELAVSTLDGDVLRMNGHRFAGSEPRQRSYVSCLLTALSAIADGNVYPSMGYLVHKLPTALHQFFPSDFDWDGAVRHDRQQKAIEFSYRPAKSMEQWWQYVSPDDSSVNTIVYNLDQIPWYREGHWQDDDDSYEYYWDRQLFWERATLSKKMETCWRRTRGSSERGELVLVGNRARASWKNDFGSPYCPEIPVPSADALARDEQVWNGD